MKPQHFADEKRWREIFPISFITALYGATTDMIVSHYRLWQYDDHTSMTTRAKDFLANVWMLVCLKAFDFYRRLVYYLIMKNTTKEKLIKTGAKAMLAKSYHAVGIQEILTKVDVPKGSFYHYFESKEAFGVAIIEYYGEHLANSIKEKLSSEGHSPKEKIKAYFLGIRNYYAIHGCGRGCLVAKLAIEVENPSAAMCNALRREFDKWTALFAACIKDGQKTGEISSNHDAEYMAEFLYTSWEGALIRMQVNHDLGPIDKFIDYALDTIIPKP